MNTDPSVVMVDCPYCGSKKGEPCRATGRKYTAGTHAVRREAIRDIGIKVSFLEVYIKEGGRGHAKEFCGEEESEDEKTSGQKRGTRKKNRSKKS
jgi:hypothetical protein